MRFDLVQQLRAPLETVEETLVDPSFLEALAALPKLGQPTLLEQRRDDHGVWQRVRYAFNGTLSAPVMAVIDPAKLTWVEESNQDRRSHSTSVVIRPDHYSSMLQSTARITLAIGGPGGTTVRTATGVVTVRLPLFGGRVEAALVSGLQDHAALEAAMLDSWVEAKR